MYQKSSSKINEISIKDFTGTLRILKINQGFSREKIKGDKMLSRFVKLLLPQKKLFIYSIIASIVLTALGIIITTYEHMFYVLIFA